MDLVPKIPLDTAKFSVDVCVSSLFLLASSGNTAPKSAQRTHEANQTPNFTTDLKRGVFDILFSASSVASKIQQFGQDVGPLTDELWKSIDDDGNGFINFGEFAAFAMDNKVDLPLGLDDLLGGNAGDVLKCGVVGCPCKDFKFQRRRCQWGEGCYNKKDDHRSAFSHPGERRIDATLISLSQNLCLCFFCLCFSLDLSLSLLSLYVSRCLSCFCLLSLSIVFP